jgi:hypothetical protein
MRRIRPSLLLALTAKPQNDHVAIVVGNNSRQRILANTITDRLYDCVA